MKRKNKLTFGTGVVVVIVGSSVEGVAVVVVVKVVVLVVVVVLLPVSNLTVAFSKVGLVDKIDAEVGLRLSTWPPTSCRRCGTESASCSGYPCIQPSP